MASIILDTDGLITLVEQTALARGLDVGLAVEQANWESAGFRPDVVYGPATSSAAAMGLWQFIWSTGNAYGLKTLADFYDPAKSSNAWASYMSHLLSTFDGRYDLALAAYDWGEGRPQLRQAQGSGLSILNYGIPDETRTYVTNILQNAGYSAYDIPILGQISYDTPSTATGSGDASSSGTAGDDTVLYVADQKKTIPGKVRRCGSSSWVYFC